MKCPHPPDGFHRAASDPERERCRYFRSGSLIVTVPSQRLNLNPTLPM